MNNYIDINLNIKFYSDSLYRDSIVFFDQKYLNTLKLKGKESIIARYLISKNINKKIILKYNYTPEIDKEGKPIFLEYLKNKVLYWSISHKENIIFTSIGNIKHGIDIENYKERDFSLLNIFSNKEYNIIGKKEWLSFYYLWTAKESIIKLNLGKLDDMKNIFFVSQKNKIQKIGNLEFQKESIFKYNGIIYKIFTGRINNFIYSLAVIN